MNVQRSLRLVLVAILLFMQTGNLSAHGGGVAQLTNQPLGDYLTTVWLNPFPAQTGIIHLTIALGLDNDPVLNQDVTVRALAQDGKQTEITAKATHDQSASRFLYEADLEIPYAADWLLTIQVAGQAGEAEFLMPVTATTPWWPFVLGCGALIAIGGLLLVAWVARRKRG